LVAADQIGSHDKAKAVVSKVRQYLDGRTLSLEEVTVNWLRNYETYLRVIKKNVGNTIHSNMKVIRAILNQAIDEDLLKYENNPFHKYKLKWKKVEKVFLTEEEIRRMDELDLREDSNLSLHRDLFIFACYAGGIRISDIMTLRQRNFNGSHVRIVTRKTNEVVTVMVPDKALGIIANYHVSGASVNDFLFPVLSSNFDKLDATGKFKTISSKTAQINASLKVIADMAEIDKNVSTHIARHTFATRALMIGIDVENLAKLMGHKKIAQTLEYA
jgi:site-specific recombinase XerD